MESCGGANFWARKFAALGHTIKLINPQFVKPFVKIIKSGEDQKGGIHLTSAYQLRVGSQF